MDALSFPSPMSATATIECIEEGHVLTITYEKAARNLLLETYLKNPQFGYYFLVPTSQRLLENIPPGC